MMKKKVAHQGFDGLLAHIDRYPPKLLMHGHTYPTDETLTTHHGPTTIEYVHIWKIIEI